MGIGIGHAAERIGALVGSGGLSRAGRVMAKRGLATGTIAGGLGLGLTAKAMWD